MEYLKVGKIFKTYGLQGEMKVFSTTDFPELRFKKGNTLYLFKEETSERTPVVINKATPVGGNIYVISLKGYNHINMIEQFIGMELQVEKDLKFLPKDTYFYDDLLGCEVYESTNLIGKVTICGNSITAYKTRVDPAVSHDKRCHIITDKCYINTSLFKFV